jgi:excisionase family DNA binding protein
MSLVEPFDMTRTESQTSTTQKRVFTTGEAAGLCSVSQQTIIRCFDQGRLDGFRVPGSRFRRIPRESLLRFMQDNGMSTERLEPAALHVLLICEDSAFAEHLRGVMAAHGVTIHQTASAWDAGACFQRYEPSLVLVAGEYAGLKPTDIHVPEGTRLVMCTEGASRRKDALNALEGLLGAQCGNHSSHEDYTARSSMNIGTYQGEVK